MRPSLASTASGPEAGRLTSTGSLGLGDGSFSGEVPCWPQAANGAATRRHRQARSKTLIESSLTRFASLAASLTERESRRARSGDPLNQAQNSLTPCKVDPLWNDDDTRSHNVPRGTICVPHSKSIPKKAKRASGKPYARKLLHLCCQPCLSNYEPNCRNSQNSPPESSAAAGNVKTQAMAILRRVDHCSPLPLATIVPAMPELST